MAVSDTDVKAIYQGNGATTAFAIPFALQSGDISHIKVYLRDETDPTAITETLKTITTHYTLNSATNPTTVTMVTAPASDEKLIIVRESPLTQQVSYNNNSAFLATDHEKALDRLAYQIQCVDEKVNRSVKIALGDPTAFNATLPAATAAVKAGAGLYVNDAGTGVEYGPTSDEIFAAQAAAEAAALAAQASESAAANSAADSAASAVQASASESAAGVSAAAAAASAVSAQSAETGAQNAQSAAEAAQAAAEAAEASTLSAAQPYVVNTAASPQSVSNSGTIAVANNRLQMIWCVGNGGAVTGVQIANGQAVGDQLFLFFTSDTFTVTIPDGGAVDQNGQIVGNTNQAIHYIWSGSVWKEVSRRS